MTALFSSPKTPAAPAAMPAAPTLTNSAATTDAAAQQQQISLQRGRSSTVLTGGAGLSSTGTTSSQLLGN